jgi:peptide/nickel transport system permease protein
VPISGHGQPGLDRLQHLVLPAITLAVTGIAYYSRLVRGEMIETLAEDYVRTARAKGLSERRVMTRHVLRNSLIPIVTLFGLDFGALLGGAIVVEGVFNIDGIGQYAYESLINLDLPPIMAITLFGAFFIVLFNALVDIAYAFLDPRVKLGGSPS